MKKDTTNKRASIFDKKSNSIELLDAISQSIYDKVEQYKTQSIKEHNANLTNYENGKPKPYTQPPEVDAGIKEAIKLLVFEGMKLSGIVMLKDGVCGIYKYKVNTPLEYIPSYFKDEFIIRVYTPSKDIEQESIFDLKSVSFMTSKTIKDYKEIDHDADEHQDEKEDEQSDIVDNDTKTKNVESIADSSESKEVQPLKNKTSVADIQTKSLKELTENIMEKRDAIKLIEQSKMPPQFKQPKIDKLENEIKELEKSVDAIESQKAKV